MITTHRFYNTNSNNMENIPDKTVNLVVTSPPYPMIEMWDEIFINQNEEIGKYLDAGKGFQAFKEMHSELNKTWTEVDRVLNDNGIVCVNIGDSTRKIGGDFQLFPNHSQIINKFTELGYEMLPSLIWHKPTNKATKFMGSGMMPPNAYVTLEHEHILIFRKNGLRKLKTSKKDKRYESTYFWEERNQWFSDLWDDVLGKNQNISLKSRNRTAAYPFEIPYRLINMYSIYEDTVLDPYIGTGTTSIASALAGRNSIGFDIMSDFINKSVDNIKQCKDDSRELIKNRIGNHKKFCENTDVTLKYSSENYDFDVVTKSEKDIRFYYITDIDEIDGCKGVKVHYDEFEE